jgi:uncharacterized membrane protein YciS (DUF1049 family)
MIGIIVAASIIMGLIIGCWISMVIMAAEISFSQERMQRKVRRAQAETIRAQVTADQLADEMAARDAPPAVRDDWAQAS